ncbi:MAG: hypothetical protein KDD44_05330, partial [Bdellovibrionales bacterium]|nr:hypothetical protein [Bdellovibrionales bacterium]
MHPNLILGGVIPEGALLLEIDPRDYQIAVDAAKAALARAEVELRLEQGNRVVAQREWELLGDEVEVTEV